MLRGEGGAGLSGVFNLDLDVFDGPFDLLVTLILKEEIDIWEVHVSRIIAEYVVKLADGGEFDLDATSQFIVLVASLLEMKSRLLLEGEDDGEGEFDLEAIDPDDAARRLLERLVRYAQFKNAASSLGERWSVHAGRLYRVVPIPPGLLRRPAPDELPRDCSPRRSPRCCGSRPRPTPATSPISPSLWWRSCAVSG